MNPELLMQPNEVPAGALVHPCAPGEDKPDMEVALRLLIGGVPARYKWYPCDPDGENLCAGYNFSAVLPGTRFAPAKKYITKDAPTGVELAVFLDGKIVKYDQYPSNDLALTRLADGTYMSVCGYAYDHWLRRYDAPDNAILVPHGDCKYIKTLDDAVMLPLHPDSDVGKMLAENGATFLRGSKWKTTDPREYYHVWLPCGWKLLPHEKQFHSAKFEKIVDATGTMRAVVYWIEQYGQKVGGVSLESPITVKGGEIFTL